MQSHTSWILALMLGAATLSASTGCATRRSELKLSAPVVTSQTSPAGSKGAVFIRAISDKRTFVQAPSEPSIPSLSVTDAAQTSDAVKARAIGRERNSYGKAMGNVLLDGGQTVESVVRENLVAAFTQAGYSVETDAMADSLPTVLDVAIKRFWSWLEPGFWAITLNADIQAELTLAGGSTPSTIATHAQHKQQAGTDAASLLILEMALTDFRNQVAAQPAILGGKN